MTGLPSSKGQAMPQHPAEAQLLPSGRLPNVWNIHFSQRIPPCFLSRRHSANANTHFCVKTSFPVPAGFCYMCPVHRKAWSYQASGFEQHIVRFSTENFRKDGYKDEQNTCSYIGYYSLLCLCENGAAGS
jgi:hypothetical protein